MSKLSTGGPVMKTGNTAAYAIAMMVGALAPQAHAASFVNGGFEDGTTSGWTTGGGYRGGILNAQLTTAALTGGTNRSAVVGTSYVDPNVGSLLGSAVYSGNNAYRVEDTTSGGYASFIQQRVNNYSDANIFFAWKSVLEGAHGVNDAATMIISLTDLTSGSELIRRQYNAASTGGGVDTRFNYDANSNFFYTPIWQIEQLAIDSSLSGHDFLLSVLGADCEPTGHTGYVFLDGFGAVTPPTVIDGAVPEPASWAMMIVGLGIAGGSLRRRQRPTLAIA